MINVFPIALSILFLSSVRIRPADQHRPYHSLWAIQDKKQFYFFPKKKLINSTVKPDEMALQLQICTGNLLPRSMLDYILFIISKSEESSCVVRGNPGFAFEGTFCEPIRLVAID